MSLDPPDPTTQPVGPGAGSPKPSEPTGQVASSASDEAGKVKQTAVDATKHVAGEVSSQASAVVGQTKDQISSFVEQAKGELQTQMATQGEQAAGALNTLSGQLAALKDGRPDEAGSLGGVVAEAQSKVQAYADRLHDAGPQGVVDDVVAFARRRPGLFLVGAGAAGFVIGRVVRAGVAASKDDDDSTDSGRPTSPSLSTKSTTSTVPTRSDTANMSNPSDMPPAPSPGFEVAAPASTPLPPVSGGPV